MLMRHEDNSQKLFLEQVLRDQETLCGHLIYPLRHFNEVRVSGALSGAHGDTSLSRI